MEDCISLENARRISDTLTGLDLTAEQANRAEELLMCNFPEFTWRIIPNRTSVCADLKPFMP